MKLNNTKMKTLLFLLTLIPNILFAGYTIDRGYTTNGSNSYGANKLLKLNASLSGSYITFTMSKNDGGSFSTSGDVYIKVGSPKTYGANRHRGTIYKNYRSKALDITLIAFQVIQKSSMHGIRVAMVVGLGLDR